MRNERIHMSEEEDPGNIQEAEGHRLLPLFLDIRDRPVLIFGGGPVAERKAGLFSSYAPVRVLSRDFSAGLQEMAGQPGRRLELVECHLSAQASQDLSAYLQGAFIIVPATSDSRLNALIEEAAGRLGILVNRVDGVGDVVVPSIIRRGSISIAISTEVPGLTRYMRQHLEAALPERYEDMARLLSQVRRENKLLINNQKERAAVIRKILEDEVVWMLLAVSYEEAYERARTYARQDEV